MGQNESEGGRRPHRKQTPVVVLLYTRHIGSHEVQSPHQVGLQANVKGATTFDY